VLAKRAEILFFYDARMCNPNGDPDENRPRIDPITKKNLVTEFRLKRTIRDYFTKVMGLDIFMRQELVSPKSLGLKQIEDLAEQYITRKDKETKIDRAKLINDHIDIKLFGILFAVGDVHFKQIGPVQFSIGQSLNKVYEMLIRMTRVVPTKKGAESGTFGEKYIVRYSFIQFHGFINNQVAKEVNLAEEDVKNMLIATWRGTDSLSTSSKFGQKARLLVKVNYKNDGYIGDLDLKSKLKNRTSKPDDQLENISEIIIDVKQLFETLSENKSKIESLEYEYDPDLICASTDKESPSSSSRSTNADTGKSFEEVITAWSAKSRITVHRLNF
jgi:CRISPR-associated protein Csh2